MATPNETSPSPASAESAPSAEGRRCGPCGGPCTRGGRRRGGFFAVLLFGLLAGGIGGFIGKSFAQPRDPAQHAERMAKRLAAEVKATPEQEQRLKAIAQGAAKDLSPLRDKIAGARKQALTLMAAPTLDRNALEALRAQQVNTADEASKRLEQALLEVADVLTPEQRQKLAAHMQSHFGRFERWHRGQG